MSRFIESIRFENGQFSHLDLHQERINRSIARFYPKSNPIKLTEIINSIELPAGKGRFKFRVVYSTQIDSFEFIPYKPFCPKKLVVIESEVIDYSFKFYDRKKLEGIRENAGKDNEAIICIDGRLTDTTYSNIALLIDGNWVTPQKPLLNGVKRQHLLSEGKLIQKDLKIENLKDTEEIMLINAMLDWEEVTITNIGHLIT